MPRPALPKTFTDDTAPARKGTRKPPRGQLRAEEGVVGLLAVDTAAERDEPAIADAELLLNEDRIVVVADTASFNGLRSRSHS